MDFIYSPNQEEESRMLQVRDTPADRVRMMARQRKAVGRQHLRFNDTELQWIMEDDRLHQTITVLEPQEYWAMIRSLTMDLRVARSTQQICSVLKNEDGEPYWLQVRILDRDKAERFLFAMWSAKDPDGVIVPCLEDITEELTDRPGGVRSRWCRSDGVLVYSHGSTPSSDNKSLPNWVLDHFRNSGYL